jgi:hypothetical protein
MSYKVTKIDCAIFLVETKMLESDTPKKSSNPMQEKEEIEIQRFSL